MKMPERDADDGAVEVRREPGGKIAIVIEHVNVSEALRMSPHNAWRVFGMLAVMLGIPLPAKIAKAIRF